MLPFLTAYDPLGASAGSIDPLGALQTYGTLANLLLPGVTTVTTRSRYLSMMCAALANVERHFPLLPGASGLAQRRRAVEPYERLWALSCIAAREEGHDGAADGLRGVTYAENSYQHFVSSEKMLNSNFPLLKFQARTGAVGTYWTSMVGGELVDPNNGALRAEGHALAAAFPEVPLSSKDQARFANPASANNVSLSLRDVKQWGKASHLRGASATERQQLGEALTANDRRECVSSAIGQMGKSIPETWNTRTLANFRAKMTDLDRAVSLGLPVVIDAIIVTEQFHEAVLNVFETLLWWGTQHVEKPIAVLARDPEFRQAADQCRQRALGLRQFRDKCANIPVREAIDSLSIFCSEIDRCGSEREVATALLDRHRVVQSGKTNGGMPKRDWIGHENAHLLRPLPRFQRLERPPVARGLALTHPYRLEPFIYMLRENNVLAA